MQCKKHKGFTLVEILVATTLFFVIMTSGLVAFSTFMRYYSFSQNERIALNSVAFAVEEVVREARFAHKYRQEEKHANEQEEYSHISFRDQTGYRVHFRVNRLSDVGYIESCSTADTSSSTEDGCNSGIDPWIPVTDKKAVNIRKARFKSLQSSSSDIQQPRIGIFVEGLYTGTDGETKSTKIVTQVTQRTLEVQDTSAFRVDAGEGALQDRIAFIYDDEGRCFDDSNGKEQDGICYDKFEDQTPCSQASSFPISIAGTSSGIYVLGDNGRVYFASAGENLGVTSGKENAVLKRVRFENDGLLPGNIKSIHSNPHNNRIYMVDDDGQLFIASGERDVEEIKFDNLSNSYRIRNIAVNKDKVDGGYDFIYIIYDYIGSRNSPNRYTRILKVGPGENADVRHDILPTIENTECSMSGQLCWMNFSSDLGLLINRISELSITSKKASARVYNSIITHDINLPRDAIFAHPDTSSSLDFEDEKIIGFFITTPDSNTTRIFSRKVDGSWSRTTGGSTEGLYDADERARLVHTGANVYRLNETDSGGVCRLTYSGGSCTDINPQASSNSSALRGYSDMGNHNPEAIFVAEFGSSLAVFSTTSIFTTSSNGDNFTAWSKNYNLKERVLRDAPPKCLGTN